MMMLRSKKKSTMLLPGTKRMAICFSIDSESLSMQTVD